MIIKFIIEHKAINSKASRHIILLTILAIAKRYVGFCSASMKTLIVELNVRPCKIDRIEKELTGLLGEYLTIKEIK